MNAKEAKFSRIEDADLFVGLLSYRGAHVITVHDMDGVLVVWTDAQS